MLSLNGGIIIQGDYVKKMLAGETIIGNCDKNLVKEELKKLVTMEGDSNNRPSGGTSRTRRNCRRKKNHEAINFLRRVVLVIVLIELMLAVSESSLMSTFFLFLTMSTTFDVKPENVLDTYCYYEPGGNSMCEDYMGRATGYSPSTTHHYRAASTNARSYYNYNFPNVSPSLEDQSYELFLAFNQSFYDAPARFNVELELDSVARNARLSKFIQTFLAEIGNNTTNNNTSTGKTNDTHDIPSQIPNKKMKLTSLLESHLRQTVEILEPSAPFLPNKEIPQVMDAMRRSKAKQAQTSTNPNQNPGKANKPAAAEPELNKEEIDKLFHQLTPPPQPFPIQYHGLKQRDHKNIIQTKDFIHRRWKRESASVVVPHETVVSPNITNSIESTEKAFSRGKSGNDQQKNMKNALMSEKTPEAVLQRANSKEMHQDGDDHHPTLIPDIESTPISISPTFAKVGGDEVLREYMKEHLLASRTESEKQMSIESYLTLAMMNKKLANSDDILKTLRSEFKQHQQQQHQKSEHQVNSSKKKTQRVSPKYFQELYAKLEKSPRHLLALMETSLFNNWKCVLELTKFMYRKNGGVGGCKDCSGVKDLFDDFPISEATRLEIIQNLSLSMDMDIFHPKTYQKAERRKRAMQQTYHDYSSAIMKELTQLKDLPVSHSFYMVFMVIKMYALLWHLVLGFILFLGCVMEDKTALNIWGIFAILTSLLHFLIEEWIDTNFQPDKTAACLWFSIIFRVYKPVAVLVVITLSSEILKRDGCSKHRGMGTYLFELVRGKKHGKKQSDKVNSSGDGFPPAVTVTKVQFRKAELDNGKIVYTNLSPSKAALYTKATCVICGATAKFAKHRTIEGKPEIPSDATAVTALDSNNEEEEKSPPIPKRKHPPIPCPCTKTTHYAPDEMFDFSEVEEEDDEEEELEIVGDEDDDDTEEDEDGYEYEKQEDGLVTEEDQPIYINHPEKKKQAAMVVILSEGKKYGSKKDEPELCVGKQTGKDKNDDKNNNNKENLGGINPLIVGDRSEAVAVVDGADLYI